MKANLTQPTPKQAITVNWHLYHPHYTAHCLRHQLFTGFKNTSFLLFQPRYNNLTNKKAINIHTRTHSASAHQNMQGKPTFITQQVPDPHIKQIYYLLFTGKRGLCSWDSAWGRQSVEVERSGFFFVS